MKTVITILFAIPIIKLILEVTIMTKILNFSLKKLVFLTLIAAALLSLTGCGKTNTDADSGYAAVSTDVAFVLGNGANRSRDVMSSLENHKVNTLLQIVAEHGGSVTFICNEGSPQAVVSSNIEKIGRGYTVNQKKTIVSERTDQLITAAKKLTATNPETDLIKSIKTAAICVNSGSGDQKVIVVIDNALMQTSGVINLSELNLSTTSLKNIVNHLDEQSVFDKHFLNLEGISVEWFAFSSTALPQEEIPSQLMGFLDELWTNILNNAKASSVTINSSYESGKPFKKDMPSVSTIEMPKYSSIELLETTNRLDESRLLFIPDSTEFADPSAAAIALAPYGKALVENPELHLVIAGMTAYATDKQACNHLSYDRAKAVQNFITENYSVDADKILTIGLGCEQNPYRYEDYIGCFLNEENRCIIIADLNSTAGSELIRYAQ